MEPRFSQAQLRAMLAKKEAQHSQRRRGQPRSERPQDAKPNQDSWSERMREGESRKSEPSFTPGSHCEDRSVQPSIDANAEAASFEQAQEQLVFPFLRLPIELQKRVCTFAISYVDTTNVHIIKRLHGKPKKAPAILRVSRRVRQMGLPVYYMATEFVIKTSPRMDEQSPFSQWIFSIGTINATFVRAVTVSFYEAGRVYLEMAIQLEAGNFPRGCVKLDWPPKATEACTVVAGFKTQLGSKYPEIKRHELHYESYTVETADVLREVDEIFQIGKQAAGGLSRTGRDRTFTISHALFHGINRGFLG